MLNKRVAIIGGGNLGQAIASGLLAQGFLASNLTITRQKVEFLQTFKNLNVRVISNNIVYCTHKIKTTKCNIFKIVFAYN